MRVQPDRSIFFKCLTDPNVAGERGELNPARNAGWTLNPTRRAMSGLAVKPDWPDGGVLEQSTICLGVDGGVGLGEGEGNFLCLPRA